MKSYKVLLILGLVLILASGTAMYLNRDEVGMYSNDWYGDELDDNQPMYSFGRNHMFTGDLDEDFDYKAPIEALGDYEIVSVMSMHDYIRYIVKSGDNYETILYDIDKDEIIDRYDTERGIRGCLGNY